MQKMWGFNPHAGGVEISPAAAAPGIRVRARISLHSGASTVAPAALRAGQMQGAATQAMCCIVEERQRSRCPSAAAPRRAAGSTISDFLCPSYGRNSD